MLLNHSVIDEDGNLLVPQKYADPEAVIEYAGGEAITRPDRVTDHPRFTRKRQIDAMVHGMQLLHVCDRHDSVCILRLDSV